MLPVLSLRVAFNDEMAWQTRGEGGTALNQVSVTSPD